MGSGKAGGEWRAEEFVHFKADVVFEGRKRKNRSLGIERGSGAGKPEYDRVPRIPVKF